MRSSRTAGAWALVASVLAAWCLAVLAACWGAAPVLAGAGADTQDRLGAATAGVEEPQVVLVGVPGLTWERLGDLSGPDQTGVAPVLGELARRGGAAALVLRGTHEVTCPEDAWLTLGAGQRAATDLPGCGDAGTGASGGWAAWQEAADRRALGPELGSLARLAEEGGTCVAAYGERAALAATDPEGRPGPVRPALTGAEAPVSLDPDCRIHLMEIELPPRTDSVPEPDPPGVSSHPLGPEQVAVVDAAVGQLVQDLPDGTTVLVAGWGGAAARPEAQALIAAPVGMRDGAGASLSSGSTRQDSLVQLTDLTPTLLVAAGLDLPADSRPEDNPLAGQPVLVTAQVGDHVAAAEDLAAGISAAKQVAPTAMVALVGVLLPLAGAGLWWHRRGAHRGRDSRRDRAVDRGQARHPGHGPPHPRRGPDRGGWGLSLAAGAATTALAAPATAFLVGLVPWWRSGQPLLVVVLLILAGAAVLAGLVWAGPWRRDPLAPPALVAAVTAAVLGIDVVWSARLGLVSVLGLQPLTAGRFFGQGNVGFGILLGSVLVVMAAVLTWLRDRPWQAASAVGILGLGATVLNGAPQAGADFGGVPALVAATGLVVLAALRLRWSWVTLLVVAVAGAALAGAIMVLDWSRGPQRRTHLGDFVQSLLDGQAWGIVGRKLAQNVGMLTSYPIIWLVVLVLLAAAVIVLRRPAWAQALWRHDGMHPVLSAGLVAMLLTWALNDSGLPAVAICLAVLIAAALTVMSSPAAAVGGSPATAAASSPAAGTQARFRTAAAGTGLPGDPRVPRPPHRPGG